MVLLQARGIANFSTSQRARNLLRKGFLVAEFGQEGLMEQVLDILGVVESGVGGRCLRGLLLIPGLTRIDTCLQPITSLEPIQSEKSAITIE